MTTQTGRIEGIWIKRMKRGPMDAAQSAELIADQGIAGNANQGGRRQVTLIETEAWRAMMHELDASLSTAERRANLVLSGIRLEQTRGSIIEIGDVRLVVMGETRPCERMDEALAGLRDAMRPAWRGGVFAMVIEPGIIAVGDGVVLRSSQVEPSVPTAATG